MAKRKPQKRFRFKLLRGIHVEGDPIVEGKKRGKGTTYNTGDIIETDRDLNKLNNGSNKPRFGLLSDTEGNSTSSISTSSIPPDNELAYKTDAQLKEICEREEIPVTIIDDGKNDDAGEGRQVPSKEDYLTSIRRARG